MPFYEYKCTACGRTTEELQKVTDPPLVVCSYCGKEKLEKVISMTGFQLTGTGWYVTDFKDKKPQPAEKPTEKSTVTSENKAPEKQPEQKVESKTTAAGEKS